MGNVRKLYFITICQALVFAYVIERLFASERGLSVLEMQYLLIFYSVVTMFCEIPAGILSDVWKKKYTLAVGTFICFFEFFISIFSYNVESFGLAYVAAAVGGALKSGTIEAILYESLKRENRTEDFLKIKGRLKFIKYSFYSLAAITGGYIAQYFGFVANYWLSLIAFPFAILAALSLDEPSRHGRVSTTVSFRLFFVKLKRGFGFVWNHDELREIVVVSAIIHAVLYGQLHEMSMLLYQDLNIGVQHFGLISLGITAVVAISGFVSPKLETKIVKKVPFVFSIVTASLSIFLFATLRFWWAIILLVVAIGILEILLPIFSRFIHDQAPDEIRVTITSTEAVVINLFSVGIGVACGYIADVYSIQTSFQVLACTLLLALAFKPVRDNQFIKDEHFTKKS